MPITQARLKISDYAEQRKANLKKKEHKTRMVSLSLTSMVDMFAILVIFLLTNSSTVNQWIDVGHGIRLPNASSKDQPKLAATLQVSRSQLLADSLPLTSITEIQQGPIEVPSLKRWLEALTKKDGYVNIVADEALPFAVMRKIIATAQQAGFGNVNLIVQND